MVWTNSNNNNAVGKINYYVAANVYIIINFLQMHICNVASYTSICNV